MLRVDGAKRREEVEDVVAASSPSSISSIAISPPFLLPSGLTHSLPRYSASFLQLNHRPLLSRVPPLIHGITCHFSPCVSSPRRPTHRNPTNVVFTFLHQ